MGMLVCYVHLNLVKSQQKNHFSMFIIFIYKILVIFSVYKLEYLQVCICENVELLPQRASHKYNR